MTEWFRRKSKNIKTFDKRDTKAGDWQKCPECSEFIYKTVLKDNFYVCSNCSYHYRLNSSDYIKLLIDDNIYEELEADVFSADPLNFISSKSYKDQIEYYQEKTGMKSAVTIVEGKLINKTVVLGVMDFNFIGGSMGSVVGHKISYAIDRAMEKKIPLIMVTASGGARMQEGAYSLMQLAKTTTKLAKFSSEGGLYIVVLTDPTTGGISASIAVFSTVTSLVGFLFPSNWFIW